MLGEAGDDYLEGSNGLDLLIVGLGATESAGAGGEDLLIGGRTSYDHNDAALFNLLAAWTAPGAIANRVLALSNPVAMYRLVQGDTVQDDLSSDSLVGGLASDWYFQGLGDVLYSSDPGDLIS